MEEKFEADRKCLKTSVMEIRFKVVAVNGKLRILRKEGTFNVQALCCRWDRKIPTNVGTAQLAS
jgi:hypothetical protein